MLQELVRVFLDSCPRFTGAIRDAIAADEAPALQRAAHALKGAVGNFGRSAAHESALRLEVMAREGSLSGAKTAFAVLEDALGRLRPALDRARPRMSGWRGRVSRGG